MTSENYNTVRTTNWKPFEEVMMQFPHYLEEKNKIQFFQRTSSLHDYVAICEKTEPATGAHLPRHINPSMITS